MTENNAPNQSSLGGAVGTLLVSLFGPWANKVGERWGAPSEQNNIEAVIEKIGKIEKREEVVIDADYEVSETTKLALIDGASSAEHSLVQEMWAELIVNVRNDRNGSNYRPFIEALKSFTPEMSTVFEAVYSQYVYITSEPIPAFVALMPGRLSASQKLSSLTDETIIQTLPALERSGFIEKITQDKRYHSNSGSPYIAADIPTETIDYRYKGALRKDIHVSQSYGSIPFHNSIFRDSTNDGKEAVIVLVAQTDFGHQFARLVLEKNSI